LIFKQNPAKEEKNMLSNNEINTVTPLALTLIKCFRGSNPDWGQASKTLTELQKLSFLELGDDHTEIHNAITAGNREKAREGVKILLSTLEKPGVTFTSDQEDLLQL